MIMYLKFIGFMDIIAKQVDKKISDLCMTWTTETSYLQVKKIDIQH